jgi:hypothetical protein
MMAHCFFDTCALKHRYITSPHRAKINRLIGSRTNTSYIADLTILEMPSALGGFCRKWNLGIAQYDLMDHKFMDDLANARFIVRPTNNRLHVLRARNLLRLAGVIRQRNLGSGDALIATCALDLAHDLKERVRFYTADRTLHSTLLMVDAFTAAMDIQFLPPKVIPGATVAPPAPAAPPTP